MPGRVQQVAASRLALFAGVPVSKSSALRAGGPGQPSKLLYEHGTRHRRRKRPSAPHMSYLSPSCRRSSCLLSAMFPSLQLTSCLPVTRRHFFPAHLVSPHLSPQPQTEELYNAARDGNAQRVVELLNEGTPMTFQDEARREVPAAPLSADLLCALGVCTPPGRYRSACSEPFAPASSAVRQGPPPRCRGDGPLGDRRGATEARRRL